MEQRLEQISVQALSIADPTLANIAETQQLNAAQAARITNMALQKAGLAPNKQVTVRKRNHKKQLGVMLLAAALATAALGIGVSGYLRYNRPLAEANFGILGARRLEEIMQPEPETYTNGIVDLTIEATLCDGQYAMVLATMKASDPKQEIEWAHEIYPCEWGIADAESETGMSQGFTNAFLLNTDHRVFDDECWITWEFYIPEPGTAQSMDLAFYPGSMLMPERGLFGTLKESEVATNTLTEGLEFTIPLTPNTEALTLKADNGDVLYFSGCRLYGENLFSFSDDFFTLYRKDNTQAKCYIDSIQFVENNAEGGAWSTANTRVYQEVEEEQFDLYDPSTFIGFVNVTDIHCIEIGDTIYYRSK